MITFVTMPIHLYTLNRMSKSNLFIVNCKRRGYICFDISTLRM